MTLYTAPVYLTDAARAYMAYMAADFAGYDIYPAYEYSSVADHHRHVVWLNAVDDSFGLDVDFTAAQNSYLEYIAS